jgi:Cellulase (glycosyl hydrolase family 5)
MKNKKLRLFWSSLVLAVTMVAGTRWCLHSIIPPMLVTSIPPTGKFPDPSKFIAGVNYPWYQYGADFGTTAWGHQGVSNPSTAAGIDKDFAYLQSQKVLLVRWYLFCDGRAGLVYGKDGRVTGVDDYLFKDIDAAINLAEEHNIHLMLVLVDYTFFNKAKYLGNVKVGGHADIAKDGAKRQAYLDNALKPMLERYASNPTIVAWEVNNEPEWAMQIPIAQIRNLVSNRIPVATMQSFVVEQVKYVHMYAHQPATVGSAMRSMIFDYWTDAKLDFYDFHYYPYMELTQSAYDVPAASLGLDKPLLIGELPTKNGFVGIKDYLTAARKNRYAGAIAWSLRAEDRYSGFRDQATDFREWQAHNPFLESWLPINQLKLRPGVVPQPQTPAPTNSTQPEKPATPTKSINGEHN